jgi:GNAT superfamily N-acetyltransferase
MSGAAITAVGETDLEDLLPLLRAYSDFYGVSPSDEALLALCRALVADPVREGFQLIAREETGPARPAVGFATVYWSWTTLGAGRLATMNDLFVTEAGRGAGTGDALIAACAVRARAAGAVELEWVTAPDNARAQRVYDRTAAECAEWVHYTLDLSR